MEPVNISEFEGLARERMTQQAFDYVAGGADDEVSLRENRAAFERLALLPRVLIDVSTVDTSTRVLGENISFPVLVAPTAFQTLAHADGELATARGTSAAGTVMIVSTMASHRLEDIAAAAPGAKWFQLYCHKERGVTQELVKRAEAHEYKAICVTVDVPRLGRRERDFRNQFTLPSDMVPRNFEDVADLAGVDAAALGSHLADHIGSLLDDSLTWDDIAWLKSITTLPLLLKGVLNSDDAKLAADAGVAGIVVSNHGGRQLDGVVTALDVLPDIVSAVGDRVEVLMDGGIRRGTDVVKALALGARAVLLGRPYVWGLAADGEAGVTKVLQMLHDEVELALALCGCPNVAAVSSELVRYR
ncbi:MAG: alpha-hydroxy acid oxidase [Gemmatimonadales bacterium]